MPTEDLLLQCNNGNTPTRESRNQFENLRVRKELDTTTPEKKSEYDPFGSLRRTEQNNPSGKSSSVGQRYIDQVVNDPQLKKIFRSKRLVELYEKELAGQGLTAEEQKELDEELSKNGIHRESKNTYIGWRRATIKSLKTDVNNPDEIIKALEKIYYLPSEAAKEAILNRVKAELKDSTVINNSAFTIDNILSEACLNILIDNPEIASSVAKALNKDAGNQEYIKSLKKKEEVTSQDKIGAWTSTLALVGAGVGAALLVPVTGGASIGGFLAFAAAGAGTGAVIGATGAATAETLDSESKWNNTVWEPIKEAPGNLWNNLWG